MDGAGVFKPVGLRATGSYPIVAISGKWVLAKRAPPTPALLEPGDPFE